MLCLSEIKAGPISDFMKKNHLSVFYIITRRPASTCIILALQLGERFFKRTEAFLIEKFLHAFFQGMLPFHTLCTRNLPLFSDLKKYAFLEKLFSRSYFGTFSCKGTISIAFYGELAIN